MNLKSRGKRRPLAKSMYKGVDHFEFSGIEYFQAMKTHNYIKKSKCFHTERDAAIGYDLMCIEFGLPPVNILKPKSSQ